MEVILDFLVHCGLPEADHVEIPFCILALISIQNYANSD